MDPLNQLPTDPEWVRKTDAICEAAAKELQCAVVLIAIQENGKLGVSVEGPDDLSPVMKDMLKDMPQFFAHLAVATKLQEEFHRSMPMQ